MDYFEIKQDRTVIHAPELSGVKRGWRERTKLKEKATILYLKNKREPEFIDVIDTPLLLFSDRLRETFLFYEPELTGHCVLLLGEGGKTQQLYWDLDLPECDCLSDKSKYYPDGVLEQMVFDREKIGKYGMFVFRNQLRTICIIRLDVAESLLRRNLYGFTLTPVEME